MNEKNLPEEQQSPEGEPTLGARIEEADSLAINTLSAELTRPDIEVVEAGAPGSEEHLPVDQFNQTETPLSPSRSVGARERMPSRRTVLREERRRRSATRRRRKRIVYGILGGIVAGALILGLVLPSLAGLTSPNNALSDGLSGGIENVGTAVPIEAGSVLAEGTTYTSYPSDPPTSGPSYAVGVKWGIYTERQPDEAVVRNLEEGAIVLNHNLSDASQLADLTSYLKAQPGYPGCFILQPHAGVTEGSVTLTSWGWMETYTGVDRPGIQEFVTDHKNQAPLFLGQTCGASADNLDSALLDHSGN